jgi:hypothetical protein
MRVLTGIEVKHNRRYGADCVQTLGPTEAVTEIAAPHQNEGPHLAAGLRARTSADRSGARGKNDMPGSQRLMKSSEPKDPETVRLQRGSAPIPRTARLSAERGALSRLPSGAPKNGAGLTEPLSPQTIHLIRGNGSSWLLRFRRNNRAPPFGRHRDFTLSIGLQTYFSISVDQTGLLIEESEKTEPNPRWFWDSPAPLQVFRRK